MNKTEGTTAISIKLPMFIEQDLEYLSHLHQGLQNPANQNHIHEFLEKQMQALQQATIV